MISFRFLGSFKDGFVAEVPDPLVCSCPSRSTWLLQPLVKAGVVGPERYITLLSLSIKAELLWEVVVIIKAIKQQYLPAYR